MADHYGTLGVPRTASLEEIRSAYRKLALQLHPDRNPGDMVKEARFKEISNAYCVLSDERQRAKYDRETERPAPEPAFRPEPFWSPPVEPWMDVQEKYAAVKASFFYQYGERKRRRQQAGRDPFGRAYDPFAGSGAPMTFYTHGNPLMDPSQFTASPPIDLGPVKIVNPGGPMPGQSVPVVNNPQLGRVPVFFFFRRPF